MVKSGLKDKPHVDHIRLALHLITALLAFGLSIWFALSILPSKNEVSHAWLKRSVNAMLGLVLVQIVYGAFVSGLKAGLIFNTFPKMDSAWIAADVFRIKPVYQNFIFNGAAVQFIHRLNGILIFCFSACLFVYSERSTISKQLRFLVRGLFGLVILQFSLGVITLLMQVPITLGVLHQVCAFLVFAAVIVLKKYA